MQILQRKKKDKDLWRMVVLVEDEDADVDIVVEGGAAQVKGSHGHVVHLVAALCCKQLCSKKKTTKI